MSSIETEGKNKAEGDVKANEGFQVLAAETPAVVQVDAESEDLEDDNARLEILKRQVETKAKLMGQNTSAE